MQKYILRRLVLMVPTLLIVSVVIFGLLRLVPGDVILGLLGEGGRLNEEQLAAIKKSLGLDQPLAIQYLRWMGDLVRGDLGNSLLTGQPINQMLVNFFPTTFELVILGTLVGLAIAIPFGVLSAVYVDKWPDYVLRLIAVGGISVPNFWIATLAVVFPAIWWGVSPPLLRVNFFENPWGHIYQFGLPALILGFGLAATKMRLLRTTMLEVLREDYIRTARSKGLGERVVYVRHAMKNAFIPVVTLLGTQLARLMGGTVIIEVIFSLPGMGKMTIDAIQLRDFTVVQANVMFIALLMVVSNLLVDLSYGWFDPRIRYS